MSAVQRRFLDECLASIGEQSYRGVDLRVLEWEPGTELGSLAAARNAGIARAAGMVRLIEASDTLPPVSTRVLAKALGETTAGILAGVSERVGGNWRDRAHAPGPEALALGGWIIDADRWRAAGLAFAEDDGGFADGVLAAAVATLGATAIPVVTHHDHDRSAGLPFGHLRRWAKEADAWMTAILAAASRLPAPGPWAAAVLDTRLRALLGDVESFDDEQWQRLVAVTRRLDELADGPVRAESRILAWLVGQDRRDDVTDLVVERWRQDDDFPTQLRDEEVVCLLGPADVPDVVRRLAPRETPLLASLRRVCWEGDVLRLDLVALVSGVATTQESTARVWLESATGELRELQVESLPGAEATKVAAESWHDHAFAWRVARLEAADLPPGVWRAHVEVLSQGVRRRGPLDQRDHRGSAGALVGRRLAGRSVVPSWQGEALTVEVGGPLPATATAAARIGSAELGDGAETVSMRVLGASCGELVLRDGPVELTAAPIRATLQGSEVTLPLTTYRWGRGVRLPAGVYSLGHRPAAAADTVAVGLDDDLAELTPTDETADGWRLRIRRGHQGVALLELSSRADDEVGPHAQRLLQTAYAEDRWIDERLAYFQTYTGEGGADSPLPIYAALRREHPDIEVRWCVSDLSVAVPAGARPVVHRSREWYETLAGARWIVTNIEMEPWFRRKPGQELLQCFHGNPGKVMGVGLWRSMGLTPRRIEAMLDHGPRNWSMLLSPSPEMAVHYREQFHYDGPILDQGYPRDDALVLPHPDIRPTTRRDRLGIAEDKLVVLYAPTWRDLDATNYRAANLRADLDLERLATSLGDRYVVLLRGHRFHRDLSTVGARLVDVTAYPDINELILASDVAVLDYSSLRFDYALTGKPMVFWVPDLEEYAGGRGFLYPFTESAPGPLVASTDEVIDQLRDLTRLADRYADARAAFNQRFNRYQDGHAAERTVEAFFGPSAGSPQP